MKKYEVTIKFKFKTETPKNMINDVCINKCVEIGEGISKLLGNTIVVYKPKIKTLTK